MLLRKIMTALAVALLPFALPAPAVAETPFEFDKPLLALVTSAEGDYFAVRVWLQGVAIDDKEATTVKELSGDLRGLYIDHVRSLTVEKLMHNEDKVVLGKQLTTLTNRALAAYHHQPEGKVYVKLVVRQFAMERMP
ncbi:hypothetical protein WV31_19405 [Magnetospirillum sp. ME-1]|uniref:hypothetical protein n=1 Tax=Magnetospirillum sp. ME-1 TaxID=1639348 RepID=UPI000A17D12F|nr:hypothetical protein [Magnetospirillum sp. ME-1]ARJ67666.1 hypothetical protein WV31_19405 [Magnetospirillum sp. ME-1]